MCIRDRVVLDVMLPGINGFEVLRRIRSVSKIPVLLLTARGEDVDRIVGLEIGADDYLPKPFNPDVYKRQGHGWRRFLDVSAPPADIRCDVRRPAWGDTCAGRKRR